MKPQEVMAMTKQFENEIRKAKSMSVDVGLIAAKVTGKIYGNGQTVLEVGYIHEYGLGNNPKRSWLRTPFLIKQKEIANFIDKRFENVFDGSMDAQKAMGQIGLYATSISQGAFTSQGYGQWEDITEETKKRKGSSQVLIDTGILRGSITWILNK